MGCAGISFSTEVKLDKWGRIYLPAGLRHVLRASRFKAEIRGDILILTPLPEMEEKARKLTYYFVRSREASSSKSS